VSTVLPSVEPGVPPLAQEAARTSVRLVVILGVLSAFGPLSLDMYLPALPSLSHELGGTAAEVQLTLTACLLGLALGQVVVGPLSDGLGRRRPLLVGVATYTVMSLCCALAPSVPMLIGLRFVQGLAGAAGIVIARAAVRDLYAGAALARFFALTMAVNGLAPILAPIIGGQLLQITSWRGVFFVLAAIGVVLVGAVAVGLPETLPPARRRSGGIGPTLATFRRLLTERAFTGYALASGLALGAMFAYIAGSPFVLENVYQDSPQGFSLIFASNALGIVAVSQISARLVTQVGARRLLVAGLSGSLLGGVALLGVVLAGLGLPAILPALFVVVASIGLIGPNATALALANQAERAGSASALLGVLQYVIGALAAPLVGLGGTGSALPMAVVIALLSSGAMLTFVGLNRARP
jgi:DHA1 family bicyclomycin/chloramphenicol resistance-like MFS transporter